MHNTDHWKLFTFDEVLSSAIKIYISIAAGSIKCSTYHTIDLFMIYFWSFSAYSSILLTFSLIIVILIDLHEKSLEFTSREENENFKFRPVRTRE